MSPSIWHAVEMTPEAALDFDRRVYDVPDGVGLGWTPYTFRVTYGAVNHWTAHSLAEFERELRRRGLRVGAWSPWHDGIRCATLTPAGGATGREG